MTIAHLPDAESPSALARIKDVFARQRETALRLRTSTASERIAKIKKLRDAVTARTEALYAAGQADFRKPSAEMDLAEILPMVAGGQRRHPPRQSLDEAARGCGRRWRIAGTRAAGCSTSRSGRCLIVSPWNYPVNLTFGPLVSAIAAGNTAIIKPSEMTPNLIRVMGEVVREAFSEDEVAFFEGDAAVAQALLDLPFDHIFFTGSPAIGKVVMAAAAKNLTSVTLELGGKSPTIVDESADLDAAAQNIIWGKYTNDGQTCIAPDHVYVHAASKTHSCRRRARRSPRRMASPRAGSRARISRTW